MEFPLFFAMTLERPWWGSRDPEDAARAWSFHEPEFMFHKLSLLVADHLSASSSEPISAPPQQLPFDPEEARSFLRGSINAHFPSPKILESMLRDRLAGSHPSEISALAAPNAFRVALERRPDLNRPDDAYFFCLRLLAPASAQPVLLSAMAELLETPVTDWISLPCEYRPHSFVGANSARWNGFLRSYFEQEALSGALPAPIIRCSARASRSRV